LANRDLAVLTPEEIEWFRAIRFSSLSERVAWRMLADETPKISDCATDLAGIAMK
jgi:hypothetical protein